MKNLITLALLALCSISYLGCSVSRPQVCADIGAFALSNGDDSTPMARELKMTLHPDKFDSEESGVSEMPQRKILAKFPAVMAIAAVETSYGGWGMVTPEPETVTAMENAFKDCADVSRIEPLVAFGEGPTDLTVLRKYAASLGADMLFVYTRNSAVADYYNPLAWGYFTVVGLFCLPGNSLKAASAAQGLLIDVKSGFPLAMVSVNAELDGIAIAAINLGSKTRNSEKEVGTMCDEKMTDSLKKKTAAAIAQIKRENED